jgi:hypothetical protein
MDATSLISTALNELLTPSIKLSDILLKIKAIAHFIGNQELKAWANLELTGYHDSKTEIPEYRKIGVIPRVNLAHVDYAYNRGWQANQPMVVDYLDSDLRSALNQRLMGQSVAEIEQILSQEGANPSINIPHSVSIIVSKEVYEPSDWRIHKAWQQIPLNHLSALLAIIRARLVDLLLELDQLGKNIELQSLQGQQAINNTVSKVLHSISVGAGGIVNVSHGERAIQATNTGAGAQQNIASGESISQSIGNTSAASLDELLKQLAHLIVTDDAFAANRQEMEQQLETVKVQLQKPEPKKGIIKRAFESITELAADGAGTMAGHAIFEVLHRAPELLAAAGLG